MLGRDDYCATLKYNILVGPLVSVYPKNIRFCPDMHVCVGGIIRADVSAWTGGEGKRICLTLP